jgi:hypothetical protein
VALPRLITIATRRGSTAQTIFRQAATPGLHEYRFAISVADIAKPYFATVRDCQAGRHWDEMHAAH